MFLLAPFNRLSIQPFGLESVCIVVHFANNPSINYLNWCIPFTYEIMLNHAFAYSVPRNYVCVCVYLFFFCIRLIIRFARFLLYSPHNLHIHRHIHRCKYGVGFTMAEMGSLSMHMDWWIWWIRNAGKARHSLACTHNPQHVKIYYYCLCWFVMYNTTAIGNLWNGNELFITISLVPCILPFAPRLSRSLYLFISSSHFCTPANR